MYKKFILGLTLASISALVAAKDENYGCRAFMCFVGGLNISECQSTIRDVKKDLAKGKTFLIVLLSATFKTDLLQGMMINLRSHLIHIIIGSICM